MTHAEGGENREEEDLQVKQCKKFNGVKVRNSRILDCKAEESALSILLGPLFTRIGC